MPRESGGLGWTRTTIWAYSMPWHWQSATHTDRVGTVGHISSAFGSRSSGLRWLKYSLTKPISMEAIVTKDIYEIVTNQIVQKLEGNVVPWRQPWKELGLPVNLVTKRPYRGINLLLLSSLNYPRNEFVTFKQVKELGGRVNKGEKAHLVILWLWVDEDETRKMRDVEPRKRPLLRYYHVFNVTQCSGIYFPKVVSTHKPNPIAACEDIYNGMPKAEGSPQRERGILSPSGGLHQHATDGTVRLCGIVLWRSHA